MLVVSGTLPRWLARKIPWCGAVWRIFGGIEKPNGLSVMISLAARRHVRTTLSVIERRRLNGVENRVLIFSFLV